MEFSILRKNTQVLELEGRAFRLQEMSLAELQDYTDLQLAQSRAVSDYVAHLKEGAAESAFEKEIALLKLVLRGEEGIVDREFVGRIGISRRQRIIELQDSLNGVAEVLKKNSEYAQRAGEGEARPKPNEGQGLHWFAVVDPIAARYGISPWEVWKTLTFRQAIIISNYLARERYRDRAFEAALHGCWQDRKNEPVWWLGGYEAPSDIYERCKREIEEYKRRKAAAKAQQQVQKG